MEQNRIEKNNEWVRPLPVPIHLGLFDRPFVLRKLTSNSQEPSWFINFHIAPILRLVTSAGSKKNNPNRSVSLSPRIHTHVKRELNFPLLSINPFMQRCHLRILYPVRRLVITLNCILLKGSSLVQKSHWPNSPLVPNLGSVMEPLKMFRFHSLPVHVSQSPWYRNPPARLPSRSLYKDSDTLFPKPSSTCFTQPSGFPVKETSLHVPSQSSHKETRPITERSFTSPKVPDKGNPLQVPQRGPCGERCSVSRANGLFIHSFVSLSPQSRTSPKEQRENMWSPSTEPHADGRPVSPSGSFTTLLLLPKCRVAFSAIPSTVA